MGRKDYLFIISHMRSNSSLLSHILGSHPEISGHAEMHQSYFEELGLLELRSKVYFERGRQVRGRFVLDKLLHNYAQISREMLQRRGIKFIFLLREPEQTIKSTLKMGGELTRKGIIGGHEQWFNDPKAVSDYYCERLRAIGEMATIVRENGLYIPSETIITDTDRVLGLLTTWLGLGTGLESKYSIFENTGKHGYGDISEKIKSGIVVRDKSNYDDISVSPEVLERTEAAYQACRSILAARCATLESMERMISTPALEKR